VNLSELVNSLYTNTVDLSLPLFAPELCLCATIVALLLARVIFDTRVSSFWIALVGSLIGLWLAVGRVTWNDIPREEIFTGLLVYDGVTVFFRAFLLFFLVLFVVLTRLSGIPDREDGPDVYTLVLGGIVGMCLMASANHLLMIFLGVEMASVPSYVLAGILKGRRQSSEAGLKYVVFGAGAAGIMLYGVSLLGGLLGSCHLPTMAAQLADWISAGDLGDKTMVLVLGGLMIGVGLAFKLSAVPFHFWCPDVFEGAAAEVNAFLSVASKAAALALLVRVCVGFGSVPEHTSPPAPTALATASDSAERSYVSVVDRRSADTAAAGAPAMSSQRYTALAPVRDFMLLLVAVVSAITCTFGNLAAYGQTNIKRLLAYSTIAHAGYMMMPVAAALALSSSNPERAEIVLAGLPFYTGLYLFMNLGAFAIVAFLRNELRSEEIADYSGLIRRSPGIVICFSLVLFSLIGLPPLAGFAGKFVIFAGLVDAMAVPAARVTMITLLVIGGLNTAISLFYYLRVVKVVALDPETEHRTPRSFSLASVSGAYVVLLTIPLIVLGLFYGGFYELTKHVTAGLFG
jgi:NADH-quinone oxidoreductase subunit N